MLCRKGNGSRAVPGEHDAAQGVSARFLSISIRPSYTKRTSGQVATGQQRRTPNARPRDEQELPHGRFLSALCLENTAANSWASVLRE